MTDRVICCPNCGHEFRQADETARIRTAREVLRESEARRALCRELVDWRDAGGDVEQLVFALDFYLGTVIGRAA